MKGTAPYAFSLIPSLPNKKRPAQFAGRFFVLQTVKIICLIFLLLHTLRKHQHSILHL